MPIYFHSDPDYEVFLATLSEKVELLPSAEIYVEALEAKAVKGNCRIS